MRSLMIAVVVGLVGFCMASGSAAACPSLNNLGKKQAEAEKCAEKARAGSPCARTLVDRLVRQLDSFTKRAAGDKKCAAADIAAAQKKTDELKAALRSNQKESLAEKRAKADAASKDRSLVYEFGDRARAGAEALKALEMGEANPPQGYPSPRKAMNAAKALGKLNELKADCNGKYKEVANLADKCRRLQNGVKLMENFLAASGLETAKAKTARVQELIKRYRKYPAIEKDAWLYLTDWDNSFKKDKADVEFLFKAAGRPMPADAMKPLQAARDELLKTIEATAPTVKPPKGHKQNKKLFAAMKPAWKNAKVKVVKDGKVVEVVPKPITAWFSGSWKVTTNALGVPTHRSQAAFTLYKVEGEKFCRRTYGVMGENYIAQGYAGGKYEKGGTGHFVLKHFVFMPCK